MYFEAVFGWNSHLRCKFWKGLWYFTSSDTGQVPQVHLQGSLIGHSMGDAASSSDKEAHLAGAKCRREEEQFHGNLRYPYVGIGGAPLDSPI